MHRLYNLFYSLQFILFHHQFLGYHSTILVNNFDQIDTLVPFSGINVDGLAFGLMYLVAYDVINLYLGDIFAFHGELTRSGVGESLISDDNSMTTS